MRQKPKKKVSIITMGCSKNLYDSEILSAQLKAGNYEVAHEQERADIVVINTCGFIHDAKQESIDTILEYVELKKAGEVEQVVVTGCLSERYKKELPEEIPEADAYFGNRNLKEILDYFKVDFRKELIGERLLATPEHYAYLKISEGCDRACSFCAIPLIRGGHRSQPMKKLLEEARNLAAKGVKELILIAQDLTYYGLDLYGERKLAGLLKKLARIEGIEWIRLHYMYPAGFPEDVLDVMAKEPKICNYLDMPLQHIDEEILKSMRRGVSEKRTKELLRKIKQKIPGMALRSTFIVGYPGETEEKFEKLKDFLREMQFDRVGIFTYSHEEDTHAFRLKDDIPEEIKEQRRLELLRLQEEISLKKNREKIGKTFKVLIDRKYPEGYIGRTEFDSPEVDQEVYIQTDAFFTPGRFIDVQITNAETFDLFGVPVK